MRKRNITPSDVLRRAASIMKRSKIYRGAGQPDGSKNEVCTITAMTKAEQELQAKRNGERRRFLPSTAMTNARNAHSFAYRALLKHLGIDAGLIAWTNANTKTKLISTLREVANKIEGALPDGEAK